MENVPKQSNECRPLLVVGSANMDLVVTSDRLPKPGETILGHRFQTFSGGKGANQAVAASRAGGKVAMIGCVGADEFGRTLIRELSLSQVDTTHVKVVDGPTGVALIMTESSGENAIVVAPGANGLLDATAIDAVMPKMTSVTHVLAQLETSLSSVVRAAEVARDLRAVFILDPAPARPLPPELLALTDWITPNEEEAKSLLGGFGGPFDPFDAVRALQAQGSRNVILKMSSKGAVLLTCGGEPIHIPAVPVLAVDSTAAGDTFNGAFAVALAEGRKPAAAVEFAAAAAALSVTKRGAQPSMPTRAEIDAAM
jgi:ribokinase